MADEFVPTPRTPLTMVSGARGPENIVTERQKVDMSEEITTYQASATPFLTLTSRLRGKRKATNWRFDWLEQDEMPREVVLTADSLAADTSLNVTAGEEARVAASYVLMNLRTREQMIVSTTASGVINVTRDVGGIGALDMVAGDSLVFVAPAYEDDATVGDARSTKDVPKYNYTQIIRTPVRVTGRDMAVDIYGGKDLTTERVKAAIEHKKSIESVMWFGQRNYATVTHIRSLAGGIDYFLRSNIWDISATGHVSERQFDEMLEEGMKWGDGGYQDGSGVKYLFCPAPWLTEINWWAKDKLHYVVLDKQIGFSCMEYVSPHGKVRILKCPILDRNHKDRAYLLDLNHIRYVYLQGRDTSIEKDIGDPSRDGYTEEWFSDVGLEVRLEAAHVCIKGLAY